MSDSSLRQCLGRDIAVLQLVGVKLILIGDDNSMGFSALEHLHNELVALVNQNGCRAASLRPEDGHPEAMTARMLGTNLVPVLMPVGKTFEEQPRQVDRAVMAADIAVRLRADRLLMLTDTPKVVNASGRASTVATPRSVKSALRSKAIALEEVDGRRPAADFVTRGRRAAHLVDGSRPHALLADALGCEDGATIVLPDRQTSERAGAVKAVVTAQRYALSSSPRTRRLLHLICRVSERPALTRRGRGPARQSRKAAQT